METFTARRAYEIAAGFQKRGVPVIMGGIHPTLAPEEAKAHCDSVFTGDAEVLWLKVLEDARRGELAPFYRAGTAPIPQPGHEEALSESREGGTQTTKPGTALAARSIWGATSHP